MRPHPAASRDDTVTTVKHILKDLQLGNSVAEFDNQLETYFVETQPFRNLVRDEKDIIAGDKGTGKTALFKVLHKRFPSIPELRNVMVIPAFNLAGNPIFQALTAKDRLEEGEYVQLWKAFVLALVGNWLLRVTKMRPKSKLAKLDQLLRGLELRSDADAPQPVFQRVLDKLGSWFRWKSAEVEVGLGAEGLTFTPRVEFNPDDKQGEQKVSVEAALGLLNECLSESGKTVWVALDRLDEAFQGFPDIEIPALRALFRTYLDLLEFDRIRMKLFVRRDLFGRIVEGGFVNLTHVNARKVDVIWDEEDLMNLLCRRIRQNDRFMALTGIKGKSDQQVFDVLFPQQIDQGSRKPATWVWMMGRIRDGKHVKPPRNLIDLVSMAKDAQLRKEEREERQYSADLPLIEPDAVRKALSQLSVQRVQDTLLAEAKSEAPLIEKFRRAKAEHNEASICQLLGLDSTDGQKKIRQLVELGFLEESSGNFKVPMLYRGGLEITQGRSADVASGEEEVPELDE